MVLCSTSLPYIKLSLCQISSSPLWCCAKLQLHLPGFALTFGFHMIYGKSPSVLLRLCHWLYGACDVCYLLFSACIIIRTQMHSQGSQHLHSASSLDPSYLGPTTELPLLCALPTPSSELLSQDSFVLILKLRFLVSFTLTRRIPAIRIEKVLKLTSSKPSSGICCGVSGR